MPSSSSGTSGPAASQAAPTPPARPSCPPTPPAKPTHQHSCTPNNNHTCPNPPASPFHTTTPSCPKLRLALHHRTDALNKTHIVVEYGLPPRVPVTELPTAKDVTSNENACFQAQSTGEAALLHHGEAIYMWSLPVTFAVGFSTVGIVENPVEGREGELVDITVGPVGEDERFFYTLLPDAHTYPIIHKVGVETLPDQWVNKIPIARLTIRIKAIAPEEGLVKLMGELEQLHNIHGELWLSVVFLCRRQDKTKITGLSIRHVDAGVLIDITKELLDFLHKIQLAPSVQD
ncbi:hypothetical protein HK097_009118 [Rhizophlyctis rosea]|uniref:Uncharacterized protein n=1 Tax=Rhizophlyctis rosea TaxID=64517 RepID=A0AAD5SHW8_9FUNG|nr:hypothetical protein HK097_009118 [Rhizophlyctis rosea]